VNCGPRRDDKWFLDEVALSMNKRRYWTWRAVDQDGTVVDILVQVGAISTQRSAFCIACRMRRTVFSRE
jgi:transposase-like protein